MIFPGLRQERPSASFNPSRSCWFHFARAFAQSCAGTGASLLNYQAMQGHMNRRQFTRCAWSAALMLAGSVAAVLGAISYLAK
jgi:hypothetical protein